jgi:hypothetical protein
MGNLAAERLQRRRNQRHQHGLGSMAGQNFNRDFDKFTAEQIKEGVLRVL